MANVRDGLVGALCALTISLILIAVARPDVVGVWQAQADIAYSDRQDQYWCGRYEDCISED
jgi:hypothetical protein